MENSKNYPIVPIWHIAATLSQQRRPTRFTQAVLMDEGASDSSASHESHSAAMLIPTASATLIPSIAAERMPPA